MKIKLLSWLVAAVLMLNVLPAHSVAKRDVNDPVLREIINEMSKKLPKFINKYGETVFVEDETLTRGAFIQAIYEYDKKTKQAAPEPSSAPKVSEISRQEFDALKSKVASLESSLKSSSKSQGTSEKADIFALIADLQPNMPAILDNSLKNSKVFRELENKVAAVAVGGGKDAAASASLLKNVDNVNARVDALAKQVENLERKQMASSFSSKQDSGASSSSPAKTGATIATISLGITMIAALFVAR